MMYLLRSIKPNRSWLLSLLFFNIMLGYVYGQQVVDTYSNTFYKEYYVDITPDLAPARERVRRLWLDSTGVLPPTAAVVSFANNTSSSNWNILIDQVLNSDQFNSKWTMFWEDLLGSRSYLNQAVLRNNLHNQLNQWMVSNTSWANIVTSLLTTDGQLGATGGLYTFWLFEAQDDELGLDSLDDQMAFITDSFLGVKNPLYIMS